MPEPQTYLHPNFARQLRSYVARSSRERRAEVLREVSDLFIENSERYSDDQAGLFDDVLVQLATIVEKEVRVVLAERLAPLSKAPRRIMRLLAFDDEIQVAAPVLMRSDALDDATLAENARTKSQQHLLAISRRKTLSEIVTDVLVERGQKQVLLSAASNAGAKFSSKGFATLVHRSEGDDGLTACVGSRPDIPPHLFRKLLATASEAVRAKLEAESPSARHHIRQAVAEVTDRMHAKIDDAARFRSAQADVEELQSAGRLDADALEAFATAGTYHKTIVALAMLSDLPVRVIERAMRDKSRETLLIIAKAIGLSWPATRAILRLRPGDSRLASDRAEHSLAVFERLNRPTAQQILEFYRTRSRPREM
jgi:uncharacterized protein (DUF2336 family)